MAAPLMERQIGNKTAFALPAGFGSVDVATERRLVTDCPAYAWNESDKPALIDLRATFGDQLVQDHETALYDAAHRLIETHLDIEWGNRDFHPVYIRNTSAFESGAAPGPDGTVYAVPEDAVYHEVWQAAADAITAADLVREADLTDVFPLRTDVQRHRDVYLHRIERERAKLHDRLDGWADATDDMCLKAEQQLDGLRAAVDNAKTRGQLIELSGRIPA